MELKTTRFTKDAKPTLNDVILTNRKNLLQNTTNLYCGLSDVHNIISAQMKSDMPSTKKPFKTYRSYKQLNEEKFLQDLEQANLTTLIENEDNVNEAYNTFHTKLMGIADNHIPMKRRKTVHKPAPFMNQQLRDRPFNLKGGYGFLFRSEIVFRTTQELEFLFFLSRGARIFFP